MEDTIKMSKKNDDGKLIIKDVPSNLYSLYIKLGWQEVKDTPKPSFFTKGESKSTKLNEKN